MGGKVTVGWYRLPRSGVPYYGPIPDGVKEIDEKAVQAAIVAPDNAVDPDPEVVLRGSVAEVVTLAEGYSMDVVRRLIEAEQSGRSRSSLLEQLDRVAKAKEDIPPSG